MFVVKEISLSNFKEKIAKYNISDPKIAELFITLIDAYSEYDELKFHSLQLKPGSLEEFAFSLVNNNRFKVISSEENHFGTELENSVNTLKNSFLTLHTSVGEIIQNTNADKNALLSNLVCHFEAIQVEIEKMTVKVFQYESAGDQHAG